MMRFQKHYWTFKLSLPSCRRFCVRVNRELELYDTVRARG